MPNTKPRRPLNLPRLPYGRAQAVAHRKHEDRRERFLRLGMGLADDTVSQVSGLFTFNINPTIGKPEVRTEDVTFVITATERLGFILATGDETILQYVRNPLIESNNIRLQTSSQTEDSGIIDLDNIDPNGGMVTVFSMDMTAQIATVWVNGRVVIEQSFAASFWEDDDSFWTFGDGNSTPGEHLKPLEVFYYALPAIP